MSALLQALMMHFLMSALGNREFRDGRIPAPVLQLRLVVAGLSWCAAPRLCGGFPDFRQFISGARMQTACVLYPELPVIILHVLTGAEGAARVVSTGRRLSCSSPQRLLLRSMSASSSRLTLRSPSVARLQSQRPASDSQMTGWQPVGGQGAEANTRQNRTSDGLEIYQRLPGLTVRDQD